MLRGILYFAHNGVDHSTGATHVTSKQPVSDVLVFIVITAAAGLVLATSLMLVNKAGRASLKKVKGKS